MVLFTQNSSEVACTIGDSLSDWWLDTMELPNTSSKDYFVQYENFDCKRSVGSVGKEVLAAVGSGSILIKSTIGNQDLKIKLQDVWYVSSLSKNLFSILSAQDKHSNSKFESSATKCRLIVNGREFVWGTRQIGGTLFKAAFQPQVLAKKIEINAATADSSLLKLYHEIWRHQDKRHVKVAEGTQHKS